MLFTNDIKQKYVSFDIFDTLLRRSAAQPTDIFRLMEQNEPDVPKHFAAQRIAAERAASVRLGVKTTLDDIYAELRPLYGGRADTLMALELEYELDGCRPDPVWTALLAHCVEQAKTVLLLSDMYLPSAFIQKMLDRCGIRGYAKLYVSCEAGACKADGSLYRAVLAEWNLRPGQLLHIGDNVKSDVLRPRSLGIRTLRVPSRKAAKNAGQVPPASKLADRTVQAVIENCAAGMDACTRLGCETFGPLLAGFTGWLHTRLLADGIDHVYFMSRDGYMMKQAFDTLGDDRFHTYYLYCSRRSFTVPLLWKHSDLGELAQYVTIQDRMTPRVLVLRLGLEPEQCRQQALACGLDLDTVFEHGSVQTSKEFAAFYEKIRPAVIENSKREYEALLSYIKSCQIHGKIAVVDIGRHGTMQNALEQLIAEAGMDIQVRGYYVGVTPNAPLVNEGRIQAAGYLHEKGLNEDYLEVLGRFVAIFESVFLAPHGSVKRFVLRGGRAEPELYAYEYEIEEAKHCDERNIMCAYQSGGLALVKALATAYPHGIPAIPPDAAFHRFIRMGTKPTLWEADLWGDFRVFDNVVMMIARPQSLAAYLRHPAALKQEFLTCPWKIGFMRRLFRIPLPYNTIYCFLKRVFHSRG